MRRPSYIAGMNRADTAVALAFLPLLIPIWILILVTWPIRWLYNHVMTWLWTGEWTD